MTKSKDNFQQLVQEHITPQYIAFYTMMTHNDPIGVPRMWPRDAQGIKNS
ncbi:hypothetical protein [Nonlabens dokdonensis]|nr:hypothetical protein [Nonlabens dokdonensis]